MVYSICSYIIAYFTKIAAFEHFVDSMRRVKVLLSGIAYPGNKQPCNSGQSNNQKFFHFYFYSKKSSIRAPILIKKSEWNHSFQNQLQYLKKFIYRCLMVSDDFAVSIF